MEAHPIDGVQMVVMSVWLVFLGVDVLSQSSVQICAFQVVGGKGIACHESVNISPCNHFGKSVPCVFVKGESGTKHPDNFSMVTVMTEDFVQFIIIFGKGCFPGTSLTKSKNFLQFPFFGKAVSMNINALRTVLCASDGNEVAFFQQTEFPYNDFPFS